MGFLWNKNNHFNAANLFTFGNITMGLLATYFISLGDYHTAVILAWIGGALDIVDGKVARKYALSTEFGVQLDSFADFLSFVLVPTFLIFHAIFSVHSSIIVAAVMIYYVISGLRRLIEFNLKTDAGSVSKHFTGVPTPLGAILLWFVFVGFEMGLLSNEYIILALIAFIGTLLNSTLKIPHP